MTMIPDRASSTFGGSTYGAESYTTIFNEERQGEQQVSLPKASADLDLSLTNDCIEDTSMG